MLCAVTLWEQLVIISPAGVVHWSSRDFLSTGVQILH